MADIIHSSSSIFRAGYLRTNAAGANLNREWQTPKEDFSPEVFYVLKEMHARGLDFCLDVHGDEALPFNFIHLVHLQIVWRLNLLRGEREPVVQPARVHPDGPRMST